LLRCSRGGGRGEEGRGSPISSDDTQDKSSRKTQHTRKIDR
jgi:hypothetical protein